MKHYLSRLEESIKNFWDNRALSNYKGEFFTFGGLAKEMAKMHVLFEEVGVKKGDKIALCAKNSARWAVAFFSSNTYEAVTVPLLADFHPDSVNSLVDHSEALVLFTDSDIWPKLDVEQMPNLKLAIDTSDFSLLYAKTKNLGKAVEQLDELFDKKYPNGFSKEDVSLPVENAKNLAIINYTSGTTSAPKGVMIRYESLSANVDYGQKWMPSDQNDSIVSMLPIAHMYGLMFEVIYPLCAGSSIYFLGKAPTPALLLGAMAEVKPYLIVTVPLVMEKIFKGKVLPVLKKPVMKVLTKTPGINQLIFKKIRTTLLDAFGGNVRCIIMGGAALNPDVEKWFRRFKLPYTVGYGMTEAAPLMAYAPWDTFAPGSVGRETDYAEVRIDSPDQQNIVGEIQAKGVSIMSGYYKNPEVTAAAFTKDGWMNTGDLGVIDAQGNIFIRGRSKDMILSSNGQNIYPEEIEAIINNIPYVAESIVIDRSNKLVALVYLDQDKVKAENASVDAITEEIMTTVNKNMPAYSKLNLVEIVDAPFEKTPKMSIKKFLYK